MPNRYAAILHGDRLEWAGSIPREASREEAIPVTVIVRPTKEATKEDAGRRMALALERIALEDPPTELGDPAEWERSIRRDRPLPGREQEC